MKELLKHYKEVREKANPHNWAMKSIPDIDVSECTAEEYLQCSKFFQQWSIALGKDVFYLKPGTNPNFADYQKQQLELENLLYGYWERTILRPITKNKDGLCIHGTALTFKTDLFKEWLEEQLKSLQDEL